MIAKVPTKAALDATAKLHPLLKAVSAYSPFGPDAAEYKAAVDKIKALITDEGGLCTDRWDGARVRLHGFTATSTSGVVGACHNWITQVTLKAAAASMASLR